MPKEEEYSNFSELMNVTFSIEGGGKKLSEIFFSKIQMNLYFWQQEPDLMNQVILKTLKTKFNLSKDN